MYCVLFMTNFIWVISFPSHFSFGERFVTSVSTAGCLIAGVFIVATSYTDKPHLCVMFLVLGVGFSGLNAVGYAVNHLDIGPKFAGVLMGLSNSFASTPGFISPQITGFVTRTKVN